MLFSLGRKCLGAGCFEAVHGWQTPANIEDDDISRYFDKPCLPAASALHELIPMRSDDGGATQR